MTVVSKLSSQLAGGAERDRTDDLRLAKPALSQLSYSPVDPATRRVVVQPASVGQGRLELPTSRLSGVRSNHLSYWPGLLGQPMRWPLRALLCRPWKPGCSALASVMPRLSAWV